MTFETTIQALAKSTHEKRRLTFHQLVLTLLLGFLFWFPAPSLLAMEPTVTEGVERLQSRWAEIRYTLPEAQQDDAFAALAAEADQLLAVHPNAAELHVWAGIIRATQAGVNGGLRALRLVKRARTDLETALELDPMALQGSAHTSLGALYYQVPRWPLAFGDNDKAEWHLKRALNIDPEGLDSLYFWGDFLHRQGRDDEARQALEKALQAAPRPGRELADTGRREEIRRLLAELGS